MSIGDREIPVITLNWPAYDVFLPVRARANTERVSESVPGGFKFNLLDVSRRSLTLIESVASNNCS